MAKVVEIGTDKKQTANSKPKLRGKPFPPGVSGNPNGRPKSRPMAAKLKELLNKDDGAALERIVKKAIAEAEEGDYRYVKEVFDRVDGKAHDTIEHSGRIDSVSQEQYEDMTDERKAQFLRTAGITDVLAPGNGEDPSEMGTSEV